MSHLSHPPSLPVRAPVSLMDQGWQRTAVALMAAGVMTLTGCATRSGPVGGDQVLSPAMTPAAADGEPELLDTRKTIGQDFATRHALFKVSAFDSLPGWQQDNFNEAWGAFKESCKALERKPNWKPLCAQIKSIKDAKAGRQFMEREFALLTVQNTDRTREGDITGYYEPMLQGRTQRDAHYAVPVYGVPNDLYILDWKMVPAAQRKGVTYVRASSRLLVLAQAGQPGTIAVDLRRFTLDTLDRRLRVRIQGNEGLPYFTRADIGRQAALDAPVLAWVDDPIALYAMQVQGAGRIRLADGRVIRLAYADQNGQPFKPMQLAAQGRERVQTRGKADASDAGADDIEHFDLAEPADAKPAEADADTGAAAEPLTRGARKLAPADDDVTATVDALIPPTPTPTPAPATGTRQLVDDLLNEAKSHKPKSVKHSSGRKPQVTSMPAIPEAARLVPTKASSTLLSQRARALDSDPSYVFFRVASDQSTQAGPVGALGVPLTAGRSLAVDPRVLPLGYPVFLDAAGGDKRGQKMQRLMFAQDTGGAIRGAVRADYFWGFGADAGKQARRTRSKGRMWVLVPHAEVDALLSTRLVTRGGKAVAEPRECLIDDATFCDADDVDSAP